MGPDTDHPSRSRTTNVHQLPVRCSNLVLLGLTLSRTFQLLRLFFVRLFLGKFLLQKQVVFEGPAHTTGKKPEPSRTEPQKTEPLYAVFSGLQPVATTVFTILTNKKNR